MIQVQRLKLDVPLPRRAYEGDAGYDLHSAVALEVWPGHTVRVPTGLAIAIPFGYYAEIAGRSGNADKGIIVHPGIIDAGYRGEWQIILHNVSNELFEIHQNDRVAQFIVKQHVADFGMKLVSELPESQRGDKGYGSSGR